ncbi:Crp/Fnr family transcriptional regulator [Mediannikoviicoccus vaginalis]|uniref:Crp/Fnr family transcriptional regulator n=1 Tax=Mediannikoviicoccus vaginalis TaxID=2899727 RepID=UPI001F34ECCD|nr:Crp/Fnr family transcriptional regulator [Mediannikoviicoccus vaginalis]
MPNISDLFKNLTKEEIDSFIKENKGLRISLKRGEEVFSQGKIPNYLFILEEGSVVVENISENGNRSIVNRFSNPGTVFGEVYLYLPERPYDYSCVCDVDSTILAIPKTAFVMNSDNFKNSKVVNNMLLILSQKAFYLNQKLLIQSGKTLREKLSRFFLSNSKESSLELEFNREELADFLGVTRPSISREIMNMKRDGLIDVVGNKVILNKEKLENLF